MKHIDNKFDLNYVIPLLHSKFEKCLDENGQRIIWCEMNKGNTHIYDRIKFYIEYQILYEKIWTKI